MERRAEVRLGDRLPGPHDHAGVLAPHPGQGDRSPARWQDALAPFRFQRGEEPQGLGGGEVARSGRVQVEEDERVGAGPGVRREGLVGRAGPVVLPGDGEGAGPSELVQAEAGEARAGREDARVVEHPPAVAPVLRRETQGDVGGGRERLAHHHQGHRPLRGQSAEERGLGLHGGAVQRFHGMAEERLEPIEGTGRGPGGVLLEEDLPAASQKVHGPEGEVALVRETQPDEEKLAHGGPSRAALGPGQPFKVSTGQGAVLKSSSRKRRVRSGPLSCCPSSPRTMSP